jgi:Fibronectin type III domain
MRSRQHFLGSLGLGSLGAALALTAALVGGPAGQLSASAAPPTNTSRATAAAVPSLPFVQTQDYTWPLPVSTDPSNRVVSDACNAGRSLFVAAWAKYTSATAQTVLARTTDNNAPVDIQDDTVRNVWGVAFVSADGSRVLSCIKDVDEAQSLPLRLTAGQTVYVVRFATTAYGLNEKPAGTTIRGNLLLAATTGVAPANDDRAAATPITAVPYRATVDTLLATEEAGDLDSFGCHSAGKANNTAWWSYSPTRSGMLQVSGAKYILARVTAAGTEVVYDPDECTGNPGSPHVEAGGRYLIEVLTPQPSFFDIWGPMLVPGGPTTLNVNLQVGPTAPTATSATVDSSARTATLTWSDPASDGASPITGFRVARDGTDSGGTGAWSTTVAPTVHSLTFRFLRPWDTYRLSVQALNADGASPAATKTVLVQAATPSAPTGVKATRGNARATVAWTAPAHTGSGPVTGYRIRRYAGTGTTVQATATVPATVRSFTATGLTNGSSYTFDVTATNASGTGVVSARSAAVTPATVPNPPSIGTASSGTAGGAITATATWAAPASTGGSPITGYRVSALRMSSTGTVLSTTVSPVQLATARSYAMTLPTAGSYRFTVQAVNAVGSSAASARSNQVTGR